MKKTETKETAANESEEVIQHTEAVNTKPESHIKITLPIIEDMKKFKPEQKEIASLKREPIRTESQKKAPSKNKVNGSPFALEPTGYYEPDKMDDLLSKLKEDEPSGKKPRVVGKAEVHFMVDDQGLYIGSSDRHTLEAMKERYSGHLLRFTGYGLNEDEAQWMILSVMEVLKPREIEDIQIFKEKDKKLVIVEVIDEI